VSNTFSETFVIVNCNNWLHTL